MKLEGDIKLITLNEVDSTNIYAKNNLAMLEDKTVVHALRQTSGRGRLTRKWVDLGEGNLFLSFVLKPSNSFCEVYSNLTQYLSVVLCYVLEEYGLEPQIKWPNDVLINGKKIAGILSETVMQGNNFKGLVLGIGVNLNAKQADIDAIPDKIATALNIELNNLSLRANASQSHYNVITTNTSCSRNDIMNEFIQKLSDKFFADYDKFLAKGFEFIKADYISRAAFLDTEIAVQVFNEVKRGVAKYVNDSGELVLEENGKEFVLMIGDIL